MSARTVCQVQARIIIHMLDINTYALNQNSNNLINYKEKKRKEKRSIKVLYGGIFLLTETKI
jgi:hypothetical protein